MSMRRSFSDFLLTACKRPTLEGRMARELLAEGRKFTPTSAIEHMLAGPTAYHDMEFTAVWALIDEYQGTAAAHGCAA
jgi:hypothetical protein